MIAIDEALSDPILLGAALGDPQSWQPWLACLKAAFGLPLTTTEEVDFRRAGGGRNPPCTAVKEFVAVCGRRSGKSRMAAAIAAYLATFIDHRERLAPGEPGYVLCLSPTTAQAKLVFRYIEAFLASSPILRKKIQSTTANEIRLAGNVIIAVHPANYKSIRGRTLLAVVADEAAFWRMEESSQPDLEVYRACIPALAATGGMFIAISSPYRRVGLLHQKHREHFGKESELVLVVQGPSDFFNPTIDLELIEKARRDDPQAALSEWDAEFRSDLSQFLPDSVLDSAVNHSRPLELPPRDGLRYFGFVDAAGGSGQDAFTLCIAHKEAEGFVADVVRGRNPPFDPGDVTAEFCELTKEYRIQSLTGDAYAGEWVGAAFWKRGISYTRSKLNKSQLYLESLPFWMRGAVSIPSDERLIRELRLLERRAHRSGKDSVDHGARGHDDYANALCGAIHTVMKERTGIRGAFSPPIIVQRQDFADE